jgi:hypothetical protein
VLGSHIYERSRTLRRHSFDHHACNKGKIKRERDQSRNSWDQLRASFH